MNKRWFRTLFRRRILISLLIVLQAALVVWFIVSTSQVSVVVRHILHIISFVAVLAIVAKKDKGAFKTTWVFLILSLPVLGGLMYILMHIQSPTRKMMAELRKANQKTVGLYDLPGSGYAEAEKEIKDHFPQVRYLQGYVGFPVYGNTKTKYFSPGEAMLEALLPELEKAQKYIFLEFFIVQEGVMWNSILEILKRKAAEGVTVRLIYDDLGCFFMLPVNYKKQLKAMGIECAIFNPFRPFLTVKQNNRDHRKIIAIDGKVAFTGGINLADEYINAYEKHGHWKDSAVMVKGKAAWSFTLMFLQMWQLCQNTDEDFSAFYPWTEEPCQVSNDGFVIPYADSPMDEENVGEHVYLQILNEAKDYVYINTPYLIVDDSVLSALCLAAKRGVDVRIATPHIWDKRLVHMTTRSYYRDLIAAGVKIYEYSKGFIHAKSFVSDDCIATVGTTNLDFRSLYLHFECGAWMWNSTAVMEVKQDFMDTLAVCQPITERDCKPNILIRIFQDALRLFAPLM